MFEKILKFFIPNSIWEKIEENPELKKILANINWLFFDRIVQMSISLFVGVWIVRYLGPERYGILSYAVAFVAFFGSFARLGLDSIVVRELVKSEFSKENILGSAFFLKLIGGFLAFFFSILFIYFFKPSDHLIIKLVLIIGFGLIFQSFDVIDYWFQSQVISKFTVFARSATYLVGSVVKIVLIFSGAGLVSFAWVFLLESCLVAIGSLIAYYYHSQLIKFWRFKFDVVKKLLSESWPLIFSSISIVVYMKIDQIMIGNMLGNIPLGNYSAAVVLCEAWYFIPTIIVGSVFPAIIYSRKYGKELFLQRFQNLYDVLIWTAIIIAIPVSVFSSQIIELLYGSSYKQADIVLSLYIWSGVFVFLNAGLGRYLIAENMTKVAFTRSFVGAIANIGLNIILIPRFGISGAAMSTLISYGLATLSSILPKKARVNICLLASSFNVFRIFRKAYLFFH
ncbi:MAG: flippase [Candidatus Moraniibacteriota bacterium]